MIQQTFNTMLMLLTARFVLNDIPHMLGEGGDGGRTPVVRGEPIKLPSGEPFPWAGYESLVDYIVRKAVGQGHSDVRTGNWNIEEAADLALESMLERSPPSWGLHTLGSKEDAISVVNVAADEAAVIAFKLRRAYRNILLEHGLDTKGLGYEWKGLGELA